MCFILLAILFTFIYVITYTYLKFHSLLNIYEPSTYEDELQHVANLISERTKLEAKIGKLEKELAKLRT